ncbi:DUF421 domain-containing protein [Domibacillus epiphyticus]|uniref:DUF421 domain-containing protein n=1 Tax=Domibacillus epiphyticus TaxID=1714355 RepID=A0A1V2A6A1_9BACI|nr:YetF domain-containing protein [Domibacillus epiphyticus]OMP66344.1 hypothetical protein BTO28_12855 [Domibacillus epiphyticus]
MAFFLGQDSLTVIQWSVRAIMAFFFLLLAAKIMGQRSISQLRLLDFIMAILIGNIIAHPLSDPTLGVKGSIITVFILVLLYTMGILLSIKWRKFRHWVDPSPFPIIENGQVLYKNLLKARISIDFLLSELRKGQINGIEKVSLALWEPGGTISFFINPKNQPLTPSDINLKTKPFSLHKTIIKEGKINVNELNKVGKDENWLKNKIQVTYEVDIKDILLATIDNSNNIKVFLYK